MDDEFSFKNLDSLLNPPLSAPPFSNQEEAYLRAKLESECTVAMGALYPVRLIPRTHAIICKACLVNSQDYVSLVDNQSQASPSSQLGSKAPGPGHGFSIAQNDVNGGVQLGHSALHAVPIKSGVEVKQKINIGSSSEQFNAAATDDDDDELEGEIEITENMDPADAKRLKRLLSNRESGRRCRKRNEAYRNEIETKFARLRDENSSLLKRLTEISQKYNSAVADNSIFKSDIETLSVKVKMAEQRINMALQESTSPAYIMGMPFSSSPSENHDTATAPDNWRLNNSIPSYPLVPGVENPQNDTWGNKIETSSMPHVDSFEDLLKWISEGDFEPPMQ